jgi:hypothetical protein
MTGQQVWQQAEHQWGSVRLVEGVRCHSTLEPAAAAAAAVAAQTRKQALLQEVRYVSGGTLNTWRSGDDGRTVAERLQVRF